MSGLVLLVWSELKNHLKSILLSRGKHFIWIINNFHFYCFRFRCLIHWIVTKKVFDMFIMFVIVLSSIALASEDPVNENSDRNILLGKADYAFTAIFTFECCLKVSYWNNWFYCTILLKILLSEKNYEQVLVSIL